MRIELRPRITRVTGLKKISHNDLVVIFDTEDESKIIDSLGQPGTKFVGEVRLADGYGEHYLLLQPTHVIGKDYERDIPENILAFYQQFPGSKIK